MVCQSTGCLHKSHNRHAKTLAKTKFHACKFKVPKRGYMTVFEEIPILS